tara:strand:- start:2624 stop:3553 length:930 start_codon:yes stop_codon:yes gene_type:complete
MRIIFFLAIFLNFFLNFSVNSNEIYVVFKVNNKIITNMDIENEYRYLVALRPDLKDVEKKLIIDLAKDSIIREKIKEEEIAKYINLNVENRFINKIIASFYKKMGMENLNEFNNYLSEFNLDLKDIQMKITIEAAWNDLIYNKFAKKIEIDEVEIKENLKKIISKNEEQNIYQISEILFTVDNFSDLQKKYETIEKSILEIGFNKTAVIHSVAETAEFGGKIGWVNEAQINNTIKKEIINLKVGNYSKPITIPGGFIVIKLEDTKKEKININFNEEYKKYVENEKNSQLNQFSEIYFKKLKKNSTISEQ